MAAPAGNEFWRLAKDAGRPKKYTPDQLWETATEYFIWCHEHPWIKNEAIKGGDMAGQIVRIPTSRPFTLHGLCIFAGIITETFGEYSKQQEFSEVTTRIREIIYNEKYEGAAVGAYNANIIARDLGLADKKEVDKTVRKVNFTDAG